MSDEKKCGQCQREIPSHAPFGICPVCVLNLATEGSGPQATDSHPGPDAETVPEPHELSGKFPNLEIVSLLGRGGMGAVYLARQTSLDRVVALKVLSKGLAEDPSFTERFAREAKTLAKLTHPNIVTVFDSGQSGDGNYLVMEYIEGVNLRDAIVSRTIDPARALAIVQQICDALQHAHDSGVVHRDIKPENILIDRNGHVKIADFGLAKLVQPKPEQYSLTGTRQVLGTRNYMAPEQIETPESVDHRADLYSLGVVLYELLTGELPIGRFAPPSTKSGCSKRLDDLVMRTLEKDPGQRFQQASMIGSAVRELESSIGQSAGGPSLVEAITRTEHAGSPIHAFKEPLIDPVPFSISGLKSKPAYRSGNVLHLASARGLLHAYEDRIEMEYRVHDPMDGEEAPLKKDSVPLDNLSSVLFEPTWWGGGRLRFKAMSLASVASVPKAKQGAFCVNVSRIDRGAANDLADIANRKIVSRNPKRSSAKRVRSFEPTVTLEDIVLVDERLKVPRYGFLLASVATLLAGITVAILLLLSFQFPSVRESLEYVAGPELAFFCVAGPVWLVSWIVPLIAANCLKHHRNYHLAIVVLLALLVPGATALMFVHILLAIWALIVLCLPATRRVFRDASMRERMSGKKPPVVQQIPKGVFVAAVICPILICLAAAFYWSASRLKAPADSAADPAAAIAVIKAEKPFEQATLDKKEQMDELRATIADRASTAPAAPAAALPAIEPDIVHPSTMKGVTVTSRKRPPFAVGVSFIGIILIGFLCFVMLVLVFMLTMLARSMLRKRATK